MRCAVLTDEMVNGNKKSPVMRGISIMSNVEGSSQRLTAFGYWLIAEQK